MTLLQTTTTTTTAEICSWIPWAYLSDSRPPAVPRHVRRNFVLRWSPCHCRRCDPESCRRSLRIFRCLPVRSKRSLDSSGRTTSGDNATLRRDGVSGVYVRTSLSVSKVQCWPASTLPDVRFRSACT